jgi:hypothetical protein
MPVMQVFRRLRGHAQPDLVNNATMPNELALEIRLQD